MSIFRRQTPRGQAYEPNDEPEMEYTEEIYEPSLSRSTRRNRGLLPKTRLPGERVKRNR